MDAKEFNRQIDSILAPILTNAGFMKDKSDFVLEDSSKQLVLLRFAGSKFASLGQFTQFMLCFRHKYLRDVWENIPESHPKEGSEYPFRIRPSDLQSDAWQHWKYQFDLNATEHDRVEFGKMSDAGTLLRKMGEAISTHGIKWSEQFTEQEALRLLSTSSSDAFIEKLWVDDYKTMLQQ